jgi:hypothetical protein
VRRRPPTVAAVMIAAVMTASAGLAGCSGGEDGDAAPRTSGEDAAPAAPAAPAVFPVVDVPPAQAHRLGVEGQGRAVALVRSSSATWLPEPGTSELAVSLLAQNEDEILPLQAYRRIDADPQRAEFGLAEPEFLVRIQDATAGEQVVAVGGPTFSGAGYYARRDGDGAHVYLLVRRTVDHLRSLLRGERVDSPRSRQETDIINDVQTADPEEISNPWLAQVLQEAAR